jgi:fructoselysine 6-kinase
VENRLLMEPLMVDITAIGDNITDCFIDLGVMFPGGNAVNVAAQVARSGCRSAYVGAVGDDQRGALLREALVLEGVNVDQLHVLAGNTAYVEVRHVEGERSFGTLDRGVSMLSPSPEDLDFASKSRLVHSTFCSGIEEYLPSLGAVTRLSFDFDAHLADDYARDVIPHVWSAEFSAAGLNDEECASVLRWAISSGATHAFATRAALGAMYFDGVAFSRVPALPVEPIDTLGAGDAFIGRVLCGLVRNEDATSMLNAGIASATRACQEQGGFGHGTSMPKDDRTDADGRSAVRAGLESRACSEGGSAASGPA